MAVAVQPSWLKTHWPYLFGAVLLHVVIAGVFGLTMLQMQRDVPPPTLAIQATVVDITQIPKPSRQAQQERERERREAEAREAAERKRQEEELAKREQETQAEQQRQETEKRQQQEREQERVREEQLVRERETQEKIIKEKAAEEQRAVERKQQADAERQKKVEAERQQKAEAERKRVAEIERKQRERAAADAAAREKQLRDQLAEEEGLMQARSSPAMSQYAAAIKERIERNWNRPPSAQSGLECVVAVSQSPNGTVLRAEVVQCNGDAAVRQSIENAVQRASPLPLPSDMRLFERNLRFNFKPDE
jgi:colicin import membrane protein